MHLLQALPAVLQLVHDAEDELGALTGCCQWLRRHSGASAVAFLTSDGQVVSGDGATQPGTDVAELSDVQPGTTARVVPVRDGALAIVPVRYAGRPIGSVVVRGPADLSSVLAEGAATLAAVGASALRARLDVMTLARESQTIAPEIIGRSPGVMALRDAIARAAATPFPILIEGESGTGKELVARAIHRLSPRRDRRFSAVNCAAFGDDLIEAELFGHARGAFTGAVGPRAGLFEDAHGGTLMLDEVAELSARAQAKLLRVLQEREVRRVGENAARAVDVRVVAATNRPLGELTGRGLFRADLLFRLAVVRVRLPPLHERVEDIPLLAHAFWRDLTRQAGKHARLGPDAVAALCRHRWPGNVRELQNVVAALVVDAPVRGRMGARHVTRVLDASSPERESTGIPLDRARATCERQTVASALARHGGRRTAAAHELGLTRQGLAKAIKRLGLDCPGDHAGVA
jgi:transcriptional regulator with GAF, ATPase, and Fis domain